MAGTGDGELKFVLTADGQRMDRVIARQQAAITKLNAAMSKMSADSKKGVDMSNNSFAKLANNLKGAFAGYMAVSTAISAVNAAIEKQQMLMDKANRSTSSLGEAQVNLGNAMGATASKEQKQRMAQAILAASDEVTMFTDKEMTDIGASVMQKSAGDPEKRIERVRSVFRFADLFAGKRESAGAGLQAALGITSKIGFNEPGLTDRQRRETAARGVGLGFDVLSQSALDDPANIVNFEKMLANMQSFDTNDDKARSTEERLRRKFNSARQALALFSAATTEFDNMGPETSTFGAQAITALAELLSDKDVVDVRTGGVLRKGSRTRDGREMDTFEKRLAAVGGAGAVSSDGSVLSPELLQQRLLESAKGDPKILETRKRLIGFGREFFLGGEFRKRFDESLASAPRFEDITEASLRGQIEENLGLTKETQFFQGDRNREARIDRFSRNRFASRARDILFGEKGAITQSTDTLFEMALEPYMKAAFWRTPDNRKLEFAENMMRARLADAGLVKENPVEEQLFKDTLKEIVELRKQEAAALGNARGNAVGNAAENRGATEGR